MVIFIRYGISKKASRRKKKIKKRFVGMILAIGMIVFGSLTHVAAEPITELVFTHNQGVLVSDNQVTIPEDGSQDVYSLTLEREQKVNLTVDSYGKYVTVFLKDADGSMLIGMNNSISKNQKNVEDIGLPPGEYTIEVNRRYSWEGPIPYQLKVELTDLYYHEIEGNNDFNSANTVLLNTTYNANTQKRNTVMDNFLDYDYYQFEVPINGKYGFKTIGEGLRVYLYDQNQKLIDEIRSWRSTEYDLSPGKYYLRIHSSYAHYGVKPYSFEVNYLKFNDIADHWATKEIGYLSDSKIINGYSDGTFRPDKEVTRYEAAAMIVRALNLNKTNRPTPSFKDVAKNHWAYHDVATVVDENIFSNAQTFNGDKPLSREEMAKVLVNAYELKGNSTVGQFRDVPSHRWSYEYISTLAHHNITAGYADGTFKPTNPVTRAQFAAFLARLMDDRYKPIH